MKPIVVVLALMVCSNIQAQEKNIQPNIIFIFADDWGYGDLSCHGSKFLRTPNIDNLAKEGIDFTSFTVNNPVCFPNRTAVMTGQIDINRFDRGVYILKIHGDATVVTRFVKD